MKRYLKRVAEHAMASIAPLAWRVQREPRLLVLMYHRVLPADHPDRKSEQPGMYVSPQTLAMHLAVLREHEFELIQLHEWLDLRTAGQPVPGRACAITFDDGWRDNYDHAYPILKQAQAPATIFLVADLVATQYSFWPNRLSRLLADRMDPAQIDELISTSKATRTDAQMLTMVQELEERAGSHTEAARDLLDWREIREMQAGGLVVFGSHTRRHTRLSGTCSADVLKDEIVNSREILAAQLGTPPITFCYPNGDTSPEAITWVRSAYRGAVTTRRGWHCPRRDPFLIRRIGVHEDISARPTSFLARIGSGF